MNGITSLGCCDPCVNSIDGLSGISLCSRDAVFLCPVSSAVELFAVFPEPRRPCR